MEYDTQHYPDIPGHVTYWECFGSRREALEAAAILLDPRNTGYDRETLLSEPSRIVELLGRPPMVEELREMGGPSPTISRRHFRSWNAALKELGLDPPDVGDQPITEDQMNLIERYEQDLEQRVQAGEIAEKTKHTTMTGPPVVLEALVAMLPVSVVEAFVRE